jgi:CRISPR-associated protein (Cas_Cas02710)
LIKDDDSVGLEGLGGVAILQRLAIASDRVVCALRSMEGIEMSNTHGPNKQFWGSRKGLLVAAFIFTLLSMFHGVLTENFAKLLEEKITSNHLALWGGGFIAFYFLALLLWKVKDLIVGVPGKHVANKSEVSPHAALILFLSSINEKYASEDATKFAAALDAFAGAKKGLDDREGWNAGMAILTNAVEGNADYHNPYYMWNVQQPLRAIRHELLKCEHDGSALREIVVITSAQSELRYKKFEILAKAILIAWPGLGAGKIVIRRHQKNVKHNGFAEIRSEVASLVDDLAKKHSGRSICVDVTGGTVEFSIAAALATIPRNMVFSYVNTENAHSEYFDARILGAGIEG